MPAGETEGSLGSSGLLTFLALLKGPGPEFTQPLTVLSNLLCEPCMTPLPSWQTVERGGLMQISWTLHHCVWSQMPLGHPVGIQGIYGDSTGINWKIKGLKGGLAARLARGALSACGLRSSMSVVCTLPCALHTCLTHALVRPLHMRVCVSV